MASLQELEHVLTERTAERACRVQMGPSPWDRISQLHVGSCHAGCLGAQSIVLQQKG